MNRASFCLTPLTDESKDDILGINKAKGFERMMLAFQFYHGSMVYMRFILCMGDFSVWEKDRRYSK